MIFRAIRDITNDDLFGDMTQPEEKGVVRIPAGTLGESTYEGPNSREILFDGQDIDWSFMLTADYIERVKPAK